MAGKVLLFDSLKKFVTKSAEDLAVRYCHEDPDFEDVSLYRPCDARVFIMGAYHQAAKDVYAWLQSRGSSASLSERSKAYTNPPEPDGCQGRKCGTCHLFLEGCVDMKLREAFEAGARSERRELLRWRNPEEELPKIYDGNGSPEWVQLRLEYSNVVLTNRVGYRYGQGDSVGDWYLLADAVPGAIVTGWRPLLEE